MKIIDDLKTIKKVKLLLDECIIDSNNKRIINEAYDLIQSINNKNKKRQMDI